MVLKRGRPLEEPSDREGVYDFLRDLAIALPRLQKVEWAPFATYTVTREGETGLNLSLR